MNESRKPGGFEAPKQTKEKIKDPKNLFHYLMVTHAPLINRTIKNLQATKKLPPNEVIDSGEFHIPAIHGLMEAISSYQPHLGSFNTHAWEKMRGRIMDHAAHLDDIPKHLRSQARAYYQSQKTGLLPSSLEEEGEEGEEAPISQPK